MAALTVYAALQAGIKVKAPKLGKAGVQRVGLTQEQEDEKKQHLRTVCPSEGWVEAHFNRSVDHDADGKPIIYTLFDRHAFPPAADAAPMCRCRKCRLLARRLAEKGMQPHAGTEQLVPQDIRAGEVVCVEHLPMRFNIAYGPSPSGRAIAEVQHRNLRLEEVKLKPESTSKLKREIRRFKEGKHPLAREIRKNVPLELAE
jgi:hypothetical protein